MIVERTIVRTRFCLKVDVSKRRVKTVARQERAVYNRSVTSALWTYHGEFKAGEGTMGSQAFGSPTSYHDHGIL